MIRPTAVAISLALLGGTGIALAQNTLREEARRHVERGDYSSAIPLYEQLVAQHGGDVDLLTEAARVLGRADRLDDAERLFNAALMHKPDDVGARAGLANVLNFSGRHRAAVAEFAKVLPTEDEGVQLNAARAYYWAGFADHAYPLIEHTSLGEGQWLRDYRVGRELKHYASASADWSWDADKLNIFQPSFSVGWRRSGGEVADVTLRLPQLSGPDVPRRNAYDDAAAFVGSVSDVFTVFQQAVTNNDATILANKLNYDSLATLQQRLSRADAALAANGETSVSQGAVSSVLGALRSVDPSLLQPQNATQLLNYLKSPAGQQLLAQVAGNQALAQQVAQQAAANERARRYRVSGTEVMGSYTWRLGDVASPWGTAWTTVGLGARDYAGWTTLAWRARARYLPADLWRIDIDAGNGVVETIGAIRNRVYFDQITAAAQYQPTPRWELFGGAGIAAFDDGNVRSRVFWRTDYAVWTKPKILLGVEGYAFDDTQPTGPTVRDRGYYNPERYVENRLFAALYREIRPWEFYVKVGAGRYSEVDGWGTHSGGPTRMWEAWVAYDLDKSLRLRAYAGGSDSSASAGGGGAGYWRNYIGIALIGWF